MAAFVQVKQFCLRQLEGQHVLPHVFMVLVVWNIKHVQLISAVGLLAFFRHENSVNSQLESVVHHAWHQLLQQRRRFFIARVRVDLDQPSLVLAVNDEVKAKDLERRFRRPELALDTVEGQLYLPLHFWD